MPATTGELRFAARLKGVMKDWDDIDTFLGIGISTSFIKKTYVKTRELIVDGKLLMPKSKKRSIILSKIDEASRYFMSQWKGANGDRSAYKIAPEIYAKLQFVLNLMDVPIESVQAQVPMAKVPTEPAPKTPVPPPAPENMVKVEEKPSKVPAEKVKTHKEEKEEKKKKPFYATTGGKVAIGGAAAAVLAAVLFAAKR